MVSELPLNISFSPIVGDNAQTLILGSMPSIKSLEQQQYYAHPRNAFWPIMTALFNMGKEWDYQQRCQHLVKSHIAVWDVLQSCQRQGSLDQHIETSSIIANDFSMFLQQHLQIKSIFFNGTKAEQVFNQYVLPTLDKVQNKLTRYRLPSTSPAHAAMTFQQKRQQWKQILE